MPPRRGAAVARGGRRHRGRGEAPCILRTAIAVNLGPHHVFRSITAALGFVKEYLDEIPLGTSVPAEDHPWLMELFLRHPHADDKLGPGVADITVQANANGRPEFHLHRNDGTVVNVFYQWCLRPKTHRTQVNDAFRWHIRDLLVDAKVDNPCIRDPGRTPPTVRASNCERCGERCGPDLLFFRADPPFLELLAAFAEDQGLDLDTDVEMQAVTPGMDGPFELSDARLARRWRRYFREHCCLEWLCEDCYQTAPCRQGGPPGREEEDDMDEDQTRTPPPERASAAAIVQVHTPRPQGRTPRRSRR